MNGGVCKLKRADCTDSDAPFNVAVCDCGGRPFDGTCFFGKLCGEKVVNCPDGTRSCNVVKGVKDGRDPTMKVCSASVWPTGLCTADEEQSTLALNAKTNVAGDVDVGQSSDNPPDPDDAKAADKPKQLAGIVIGVLVVVVLVAAAFYYGFYQGKAQSAELATDAVDDVDAKQKSSAAMRGKSSTTVENAAFDNSTVGFGLRRDGAGLASGADYAEVEQPQYEEVHNGGVRGTNGRVIAPDSAYAMVDEERAAGEANAYLEPHRIGVANDEAHASNVYLEPTAAGPSEATYEELGAAAAPVYDAAGNVAVVGDAVYDSALASNTGETDVMYDAASSAAPASGASGGGNGLGADYALARGAVGGEAMYDSAAATAAGDHGEYMDVQYALAAGSANGKGATLQQPATYEYALAAGDADASGNPTYALAEGEAGPAYVLANGDIEAGPAYALADGDAGPTYALAGGDAGPTYALAGGDANGLTASEEMEFC